MTAPSPAPGRHPEPRPGPPERHAHPRISLAWKIFSIAAGSLLILAGLLMLVTPGPGWLAIFGGLAMLSPHSRWAHAILHWLKEKLHLRRRQSADRARPPS
ncbi:MAG TPA: PGPGW domain-containing protein [Candidatus Polarisedimenticolia bacterium]|nr:PGPGW domain-containing protein [Candidatus Polarisedimenticolia bacterium]